MTTALQVMNQARLSFIPPERLSISEWAEDNITIASGNMRGMRFDSTFMPYLNAVMDAVMDPDIERVVCRMAARSGKTFSITTVMAYFMAHDPKPILYMRPSDEDVQKFSKEELASLILNTPTLREKIDPSTQTYNFCQFPGGSLRLVGSNSPGKLAGYGVWLALMDEIDKYSPIPLFGNPVDLAEERTAEFALYGRKILFISTPTLKGEGVDGLYEDRSDRRVLMVPCIHCGFEQQLKFKGIKFKHSGAELLDTPYYECAGCHGHINDSQRLTMMRRGHFVAQNPERKGFAGFALSRLYSPLATMESIVKDFLAKQGNVLMLRQFVNDVLGEAWDPDREAKASSSLLYNRREKYPFEVPKGVGFLTMAVDVQGNPDAKVSWLEYEIAGWGKDGEKWVIEHGQIYGNLSEPAPWADLLQRANKPYTTWAGTTMTVVRAGVDTQGGYTSEVRAFLKGKKPRWIGVEGKKNKPGAPLITRRKNAKITSWEVGTDTAKDTVFAVLSVAPLPDGAPTPNCYHFPDSLDEEYFASLLSEAKVEKIVGGVKVKKYKQTRVRNEVLDLAVYGWWLYNHVLRTTPSLLAAELGKLERAANPELNSGSEGARSDLTPAPAPLTVAVDVVRLRKDPAPVEEMAFSISVGTTMPAPAAAVPEPTARERYLQACKAAAARVIPR